MEYILLCKVKDQKYEGFERNYYLHFNSYHDLQRHLLRYRYVSNKNYVVFQETDIKRYNKYAKK